MITTAEFEKQYKMLNAAQKEAVDAIEGPVMVAAGPGTGKTQILALRIANILLKTDTQPENVLCLTFTESGVFSMRRRLAAMMGNAAYKIAINTFHGFCNDIIREHPEDFEQIIGCSNITDVDQIRLLERLIRELPLEKLRPFNDPLFYLKDIRAAIGKLKQEGIRPERFKAEIEKMLEEFWKIEDLYSAKKGYEGKLKTKYQDELKKIEKNQELALLYEAYEQALREEKAYDYNDMILEVNAALERDRDLLLSLQETYQYILVDEHQDTNNGQNRVLELLASYYESPNLFVVGDDKQAIFRFQGASLENFMYFRRKYADAKFIVLEENYRSTQNILDSAHKLIPGEKRLRANRDYENRLLAAGEFSTRFVEEYFIARSIAELIQAGEKPEEIAVLYRDNKDAFPLAAMLDRLGVPCAIESNQDILADQDARKLVKLLRAVVNFGSDREFLEALHIDFLGIDPLDLYRFIHLVGTSHLEACEAARATKFLAERGVKDPAAFERACSMLSRFKRLADNEDVAQAFTAIVRESGLLASILRSPAGVEKIDKLNTLFDEVKAMLAGKRDATLRDFVAHIDLLEAHEIYLKRAVETVRAGRVRLMTAHGSKGLEFDHVFIAYANDRHWGNKRRFDKIKLPPHLFSLSGAALDGADENDDERRLFYVALTRAKKTATVTWARQDKERRELLPSMFVAELDPELMARIDAAPYEADFLAQADLPYRAAAAARHGIKDPDFVRELFLSRGFAVTHLNNYLSCPWRYFYANLLRLPQAEEKHLLYGTAIHGALEDFFDRFKEDPNPPKEYLILRFDDHLARQPLSRDDFAALQKRGREALAGYYDAWHETWRTRVLVEFDIRGVILSPEVVLTGKIDKMEFLGDGNEVNVVDYKTGKPKSRGEIEGETKNSEGNIKRQLAFYKLLLDKYEDGKYEMVSADIDFIEPNERGKHKKESFAVTREEVAALEDEIRRVAGEILNLEFWDRRCDDPKCEYCALRGMLEEG